MAPQTVGFLYFYLHFCVRRLDTKQKVHIIFERGGRLVNAKKKGEGTLAFLTNFSDKLLIACDVKK